MSYYFSKPSIFLSQYVKHYWAIEDCVPNDAEHIQRIVPNGLMELMFYLGNKPKSLDKNKNISENTILSGQQKCYYDIVVSGKLSLFSISFQPYGAKMFFNIPSNEFYDKNIPLKYFLKDVVDKLECTLFESDTFDEKIRIVESFLFNQLRNNSKEYEISRIMRSIALINQANGLIDIETLSSSAYLSRKQYERTFAEYIGSSPKQFLRTVRFQNLLHKKYIYRNINLTELAYNCGYYDQSHMINEFKILTGITPTQYFSECEPHSDYFQ